MYGKVTDSITGAPVRGICVTLGQPGAFCWAITDSSGNYAIKGDGVVSPGQTDWRLYFFTCVSGVFSLDGSSCTTPTPGYRVQGTDTFKLTGGVIRKDWPIHK